jgi:hypothetical protein
MIDYARKNDYDSVMLINSDIELRDQRKVLGGYLDACERGLVISNRYDHSGNYIKGIRYSYGIDVFVVHKKFYHLFSEAPFVMGQTWWDYWLPYRFVVNDLPIFNIKASIFYHKEHHVQYSAADWMRMCEHFISLEGYKSISSKPRRKPAHLRMNRHSNGEPNYGGVSQEVFGIISAKIQMI